MLYVAFAHSSSPQLYFAVRLQLLHFQIVGSQTLII